MDSSINLKNIDVTYNLGKKNEFKAVADFNMDIYPGEFVAFFGPSGCGKSTLFYSILGILKPSAGDLFVRGENPYTFSAEEMVHYQSKTIGIIQFCIVSWLILWDGPRDNDSSDSWFNFNHTKNKLKAFRTNVKICLEFFDPLDYIWPFEKKRRQVQILHT